MDYVPFLDCVTISDVLSNLVGQHNHTLNNLTYPGKGLRIRPLSHRGWQHIDVILITYLQVVMKQ